MPQADAQVCRATLHRPACTAAVFSKHWSSRCSSTGRLLCCSRYRLLCAPRSTHSPVMPRCLQAGVSEANGAAAPAAAAGPIAAAAGAAPGSENQVTASQLQLTQLVGSAGDQQVLLNQPKASIIARARLPRGDRLVSFWCLAVQWMVLTEMLHPAVLLTERLLCIPMLWTGIRAIHLTAAFWVKSAERVAAAQSYLLCARLCSSLCSCRCTHALQ